MSYFARINKQTKIVEEVIRATKAYVDSLDDSEDWVQTSYNNNFKKQYAGVGFVYDEVTNSFKPPKPFPSWIFNEDIWDWEAPVPKPPGGELNGRTLTTWNEDRQLWDRHYSQQDVLNNTVPNWYMQLVNGEITESPVPYPNDGGSYDWDEKTQSWIAIN